MEELGESMYPSMYPPLNPEPSTFGYPKIPPNPAVMTVQPAEEMMAPQPVCKEYLGLSIMNMVICCPPLGIAALVFSILTRTSVQRQNMASAAKNSRTAFRLNMMASGIGFCIHLIWIAVLVYVCVMKTGFNVLR